MTRIVRSHDRYKRPSRKRKAVALEVPAVVTISDKTRRRVSNRRACEATDRKSAIVTARRPGKRQYTDVPEMTEEESRRRGDAADAMMQEIKRRIAEKPS